MCALFYHSASPNSNDVHYCTIKLGFHPAGSHCTVLWEPVGLKLTLWVVGSVSRHFSYTLPHTQHLRNYLQYLPQWPLRNGYWCTTVEPFKTDSNMDARHKEQTISITFPIGGLRTVDPIKICHTAVLAAHLTSAC